MTSPQLTADNLRDPIALRLLSTLRPGEPLPTNERIAALRAIENFRTLDPDTVKMRDRASVLAARSEPVVIRGESGTGKELVAAILHGERTGKLVAVNTTAVPETLFESELFGHMKGAFTGADSQRAGFVDFASDGTLFLDEIGDMPLGLQPKLLRVLQTGRFRQVGANTEKIATCRVVAATHMNLELLVEQGKFRLDLYRRLTCFQLWIKPLRERRCDVGLFTGDAGLLAALATNEFKGNVGELLNYISRWEVFGEID